MTTFKSIFPDSNLSGNKIQSFIIKDYMQARILPSPHYFTDEDLVGVKLFTFNPVEEKDLDIYKQQIFDLIRSIISDFLANAQSVQDFKPGSFPLKDAFLKAKNQEI